MEDQIFSIKDICENMMVDQDNMFLLHKSIKELVEQFLELDGNTIASKVSELLELEETLPMVMTILLYKIYINKKFRNRYGEIWENIMSMDNFSKEDKLDVCENLLKIKSGEINNFSIFASELHSSDLADSHREYYKEWKRAIDEQIEAQEEEDGMNIVFVGPYLLDDEKCAMREFIDDNLSAVKFVSLDEEGNDIYKEEYFYNFHRRFSLTPAIVRYIIKTKGELTDREPKEFIIDYLTRPVPGSYTKQYYRLGALDLLKSTDFSNEVKREILETAKKCTPSNVRKKAYELGYRYFGKHFLQDAFDDDSKQVVKFAEDIISGNSKASGNDLQMNLFEDEE